MGFKMNDTRMSLYLLSIAPFCGDIETQKYFHPIHLDCKSDVMLLKDICCHYHNAYFVVILELGINYVQKMMNVN